MTFIVVILLIVLFISFGAVVFIGAPYLPTMRKQIHAALELANLKPGQKLVDLGCGDGRVLVAAAKVGVDAVGYEINPFLALIAWIRTLRFRKHVKVVWGDYWSREWPEDVDCVFVFLIQHLMPKLEQRVVSYAHRPLIVVSFAFKFNSRKAAHQKDGVFLYEFN